MALGEVMNQALKVKLSLSFFFLLAMSSAYSLASDKEKTIHVVSDSADLSQQQHKGMYTGNVKFSQGTTNLHAEKAITEGNVKNQLTLAVAYGNKSHQAHYWTEIGPDKPPLHAYADIIQYHPLTHTIELIGHARVIQGQNSLLAAKITYDVQQQHVVSHGDDSTRTTIIFYPEKKKR